MKNVSCVTVRVLKVTLISVKIWAKENIKGLERINKMKIESAW
jgi:hypothetical protein